MKRISIYGIFLLLITILLTSIGCLLLYSAAGGNFETFSQKHLVLSLCGIIVAIAVAIIPTKYIFQSSYYFYFLCVVLLIIAEIIGHTAMGAQRWLKLWGVTLQPSEMMKIGVVLALGKYLANLQLKEVEKTKKLIIPLFITFLPVVIILKQPNLGTAAIVTLISGSIFFTAGVQRWKFFAVGIPTIAAIPIIFHFLHDYQKKRITAFLHPEDDLLGSGYNIMQSKIAIGSGGVDGKGLLEGTQSQLSFLPEKHTDFIFTTLAEEFGFYGTIITLLLYLLLTIMIYMIAIRNKNDYGKIISIGIASMIFFHVFINIGMISGMLPAVGTPLPLLSYGGSNLMTTFMGIGLVLNSDINRTAKRFLRN